MAAFTIARGLFVAAVGALSLLAASPARASCVYRAPQPISGRVKSCNVVDPSSVSFKDARERYRGLVVELDDGKGKDVKAWIPQSEGASCSALPAGATLKATMSFACCDGDPNPPCYIGTANILTEVAGAKGAPPDPPPASSAPVVAPTPSITSQPPAPAPPPAASAPTEPAPGPRNCGCRVIGTASIDARWTGVGVALVFAIGARRRRRGRAR